MIFSQVRKRWEKNARLDPMWAILAQPSKEKGGWDTEAFFETGRRSLESALDRVGISFIGAPFERALDFGCGMGRISQALAAHGRQVHGVDISGEMVRLAEQFNQFPASCQYHHNPASDLGLFPSEYFDFVYCVIVLQHMPPSLMKGYLKEFLRVLSRKGKILVQIPAQRSQATWQDHCKDWLRPWLPIDFADRLRLRKRADVPILEMYGLTRSQVKECIENNGGEILRVESDKHAGPAWTSYTYLIGRR
ncbi:MAG: class I SAM-dependent methyltransferase [Bdellovibrionales bacterium]|nr:class I SAM-dependent methyltransferase [Bdellovibrionales bacterium]